MKKLLLILVLLNSFFGFISVFAFDTSNCKSQKFIVTGYYSPLKNQQTYYRGSYEADKKLNGNGTNGASGKKVFNGMIAAPKSYSFGTKIYFPSYGIGEVQDRGGAILSAGNRGNKYDRIDIWMGHGDEGLKRALSFGKRELIGYFCDTNEVGFNFSNIKIANNFYNVSLWTITLSLGRNDNWVLQLQKYLNNLGYLDSKSLTGYYGPKTQKAVCDFQVEYGMLNINDELCGYFGPITRNKLKNILIEKGYIDGNKVQENNETPILDNEQIVDNNIEEISGEYKDIENVDDNLVSGNEKENEELLENTLEAIQFENSYKIGDKSKEIVVIQQYLKNMGFYEFELNGIYDNETAKAVYKFQLKYKIFTGDEEVGVYGYFGPRTRLIFSQVVKFIDVNNNL